LADYLDRLDTAGVPQSRRVISALGPRMLHLAAQRSAGAHPFDTTPEHTQQARQLVGPDALIIPIQGVAISTDTDYARALGRQALQLQLPLANYRNLFKRLGFTDEDIAAPGSDRLVDALVAQGSIPQVAGRLDAHLAAGANQVSIQVVNDAPEVLDLVRELAAHLAK
jgi:probable F420-dependent oxidoreductase